LRFLFAFPRQSSRIFFKNFFLNAIGDVGGDVQPADAKITCVPGRRFYALATQRSSRLVHSPLVPKPFAEFRSRRFDERPRLAVGMADFPIALPSRPAAPKVSPP
jgi:hypothetical protein